MIKLKSLCDSGSLTGCERGLAAASDSSAEEIGACVKTACTEVLRMNERDALDGASTLHTLRGGLSSELNPYLVLLRKVGNIAPATADGAVQRAIDTNILLKKWILAVGSGQNGDEYFIKEARCFDLISVLVSSSWKISFSGVEEWRPMFQFLQHLVRDVPGLRLEFNCLPSVSSSCVRFPEDTAILQRSPTSKVLSCMLPSCLSLNPFLESGASSTKTDRAYLHQIVERQRKWWVWLQCMWGPCMKSASQDREHRCEAVLRHCSTEAVEGGLDSAESSSLELAINSFLDSREICVGILCRLNGSGGDLSASVKSGLSLRLPGAMEILHNSPLLRSFFELVNSNPINVVSTPWTSPYVSTDKFSSDSCLDGFDWLPSLVPDLPLSLLSSDSMVPGNILAVLRIFTAAINENSTQFYNLCIHSKLEKLVSVKCLLNSVCYHWTQAFIERFVATLLTASSVSRKRPRDDGDCSSDLLEHSVNESEEMKYLYSVLIFTFGETKWESLARGEAEEKRQRATPVDMAEAVLLWAQKGPIYLFQLIINNELSETNEMSSSKPFKLTYCDLYFVCQIIISVILTGFATSGKEHTFGSRGLLIDMALQAVTSRNKDEGLGQYSILLRELDNFVEACSALVNITEEGSIHKDCPDVINRSIQEVLSRCGTNMLKSLILQIRESKSTTAHNHAAAMANEPSKTQICDDDLKYSAVWEHIKTSPIMKRYFPSWCC